MQNILVPRPQFRARAYPTSEDGHREIDATRGLTFFPARFSLAGRPDFFFIGAVEPSSKVRLRSDGGSHHGFSGGINFWRVDGDLGKWIGKSSSIGVHSDFSI